MSTFNQSQNVLFSFFYDTSSVLLRSRWWLQIDISPLDSRTQAHSPRMKLCDTDAWPLQGTTFVISSASQCVFWPHCKNLGKVMEGRPLRQAVSSFIVYRISILLQRESILVCMTSNGSLRVINWFKLKVGPELVCIHMYFTMTCA